MTARSHHHGHAMCFDEAAQEWRYEDDDTLVKDNWRDRPCGKCKEPITLDGHDPCIANLPGVMNACCGHGDDKDAYVQFSDGEWVGGAEAVTKQQALIIEEDSD